MYMGFPGGSDGKEFTCNAGDLEKGMANQSILKEISPGFHWKDWCWSWNCNTLATSFEELTHWKRPWCWEGLGAGEGDDRGWDGWMASLIQWAWVWVNSRSWWWTGSWRAAIHGVIKSRTRLSDWTELNHSSILAWRIPWTEEPGGLQSMGSQSQTWPTNIFTYTYLF